MIENFIYTGTQQIFLSYLCTKNMSAVKSSIWPFVLHKHQKFRIQKYILVHFYLLDYVLKTAIHSDVEIFALLLKISWSPRLDEVTEAVLVLLSNSNYKFTLGYVLKLILNRVPSKPIIYPMNIKHLVQLDLFSTLDIAQKLY